MINAPANSVGSAEAQRRLGSFIARMSRGWPQNGHVGILRKTPNDNQTKGVANGRNNHI
ncbi:MAG TPA: hypothetical protein VJ929_00330 [Roseovarius sp.]|nr:hypothetical protein [Roseovarius sp.]